MSNTNTNVKPTTTVTIVDPRILAAMDEIKADLKRLLDKTSEKPVPQQPVISYFPKGYF